MGLGIGSLATSMAGQAFDRDPGEAATATPEAATDSASMPGLSAPAIQSLMLPLIHYPDHLIQVALAASATPEEIALAARYLSDPSSINGEPDFGPNTLALMQHPGLLRYMSEHLVWVNELGAQYTEQPQALWSALDTARGARVIVVEPGPVTTTGRTMTYHSNPVRLWPSRQYLHHSSIWPRSQHTSRVAYGWGYVPGIKQVSTHHGRHDLRHAAPGHRGFGHPYALQHKRQERHQPRWYLHNDWLFHYPRHSQERGHRQQHSWNHRQEHRRAHKQERRQDQRRAHRQDHRQEHRQEYRQEHRREHRREHRQDHRNDSGGFRERYREPRRHSTQQSAQPRQNRPAPTRNFPREWMQGTGLLR